MFIPTEDDITELVEIWFKIVHFKDWYFLEYENYSILELSFSSDTNRWRYWIHDMEMLKPFNPKSIQDIKTIIRLITTQ